MSRSSISRQGYNRNKQESFAYFHVIKNGSVQAFREQARARARAPTPAGAAAGGEGSAATSGSEAGASGGREKANRMRLWLALRTAGPWEVHFLFNSCCYRFTILNFYFYICSQGELSYQWPGMFSGSYSRFLFSEFIYNAVDST